MTIMEKSALLRELAEELELHGLYFQHVALCRRRAWLHLAGATHVARNRRAQRGLALHQTEKRAGDVPRGLGIAPDAIDFDQRLVIERKGSGGASDAVSRQALFYAAFMTAATGTIWRAEVQVYGTRRRVTHRLTETVLDQLIVDARYARDLLAGDPPVARVLPLCDSCSCHDLCWDAEGGDETWT